MRFPPLLLAGARVALVAPSGPLASDDELRCAIDNTRAMGWEPVVAEHALARDGYLAGTDADRLADLNAALRDDRVDGIWCLRGGYGAMRLLDGLDYAALERRPKALIGYSDATALHAAIGRRLELVSFHGPTARVAMTEFSCASLRDAVAGSADRRMLAASGAATLRAGVARGRLVGGNLTLLAALAGTPFAPRFDGAILALEDVNESVYRIDRMLTQLRLSGALDRVAGLMFGHFTQIPDDAANAAYPLDRLLGEVADRSGVPCVAHFPMGHVADQFTLPLGADAELDATAGSLVLRRP
jgi:muramoyltetrapeptide carboxypeptidase